MINEVVLVVMLMIPGMSEPKVMRRPMASFEERLASVKQRSEGLKLHDGEQYIWMGGCQVNGAKADPS